VNTQNAYAHYALLWQLRDEKFMERHTDTEKVIMIRVATKGLPSPSLVNAYVESPLQRFMALCSDNVTKLVLSAPTKWSDLDHCRLGY